MAGNIQNVNLSKLNSEISSYFLLASKFGTSVSNIEHSMNQFPTCWTGQRINKIITLWNQNLITIIKNEAYFQSQIGPILLEIADQYSLMEKGSPKDCNYELYEIGLLDLRKIPLTDASTIRFDQAKAQSIVRDIQTNSANAQSYLNQLVSKLDSMQAYSDSLKTLHTNYTNAASKCKSTLTTLYNSIQQEATKALNDVKVTESYNEKDARRASNTSTN